MVNTQLLDNKINDSGLKVGYIIDQMGISRQAFDKKKKNLIKFRVSEVFVLCTLLHIPDAEKMAIFFANEVK